MDRDSYRPSSVHPAANETGYERTMVSNLIGIAAVACVWLFWLRASHDGAFFGWLVVGASVGLRLDGMLGQRRLLTPLVQAVVPFLIAFAITSRGLISLLTDTEPGMLLIVSGIFWAESMVPVGLMLMMSTLVRSYQG